MRISDGSSDVCSSDLGTLNVVCGRYMREGERVANPGVLRARQPQRAQVTAAPRWWEKGYKSRIGGFGMLGDEMMRSEERRVGKEGVSTCRSRGSLYN